MLTTNSEDYGTTVGKISNDPPTADVIDDVILFYLLLEHSCVWKQRHLLLGSQNHKHYCKEVYETYQNKLYYGNHTADERMQKGLWCDFKEVLSLYMKF